MKGWTGQVLAILAAVSAAGAASAGGPAPAPTSISPSIKIEPLILRDGRHPVDSVRALNELQDRAAKGGVRHLASQVGLVVAIAKELRSFRDEVWSSARNRHSAVKYVLSGGDPAILDHLVGRHLFPEDERQLALAAVAYGRGRVRDAASLLERIDHALMPASLAGHVVLVKAMMIAQTEAVRALQLCDQARLLSPGTLVEETALRLAIELAIATGNEVRLRGALITWLRRFPLSPFSSSVDERVARHLAVLDMSSPQRRGWWSRFVELVPIDRKGPLLASIAEGALRAGKLSLAAESSRLAADVLDRQSPVRPLLAAIAGAALIALGDRAEALIRLSDASRASASAEVMELIAVAGGLERFIYSPPSGSPSVAADRSPSRNGKVDAEIARAMKRLAVIDELIDGAMQ